MSAQARRFDERSTPQIKRSRRRRDLELTRLARGDLQTVATVLDEHDIPVPDEWPDTTERSN